jgi:hypothetical protein
MEHPDSRRLADDGTTMGRTLATSALAASLGLALAASGCDTVAKVSFQTEQFEDIDTTGFATLPGQCNDPRASNGRITMRMALVTDGDRPIRKGETVNQQPVNLDSDAVSLQGGRLFEAPDRTCTPNSGGGSNGATPVTCGPDTTCTNAVQGGSSDLRRCNTETELSIDDVSYASSKDKPQRFGLLVENTASLEGFYPAPANASAYDSDLDGEADTPPPTGGQRVALASDESGARATSLQTMLPVWRAAAAEARTENIQTQFGFWSIRDSTEPVSMIAETTGNDENYWATDNATVGDAVNDTFDTSNVAIDSRADIWQSIEQVVRDGYTGSNAEGKEKILAVVVDGPPELPVDASGTEPSEVIDLAAQNNVKVFVVQFDPAIQGSSNDVLLRDDPGYYRAQDGTCGSESDCSSWETCREVHGYASSTTDGNNDVLSPAGGTPAAGERDNGTFTPNQYCMPERGPQGRFGPVEEYAELACATGGGYRYLKTASDLSWAVPWLPYAMDGLWRIDATVNQFQDENLLNGQPVRIGAQLSVSIGGTQQTRTLSQIGAERDPNEPESGDNRGIVFTTPEGGGNNGNSNGGNNSNGGGSGSGGS